MLIYTYLSNMIKRNVNPCSLLVNHIPDIFNTTDSLAKFPVSLLLSL